MKNWKKLFAINVLCVGLSSLASAQVNVTTWQNGLLHHGANLNETSLTPANAPTVTLRFTSEAMDGQIYTQPLIVSNLNFSGTLKNVAYVATQRGWIYAIDAENAGPFIWSKSLIPAGAVYVPQADVNSGDISDALSLTATPVIDAATQTIYVLCKYKVTANGTYQQRLHALDLRTGADKSGSPVIVNPTFAGSSNWNGTESVNGVIPFNPLRSHARCALILVNGVVYLSYASHSDTDPYHGEVVGFDATTLQWLPAKTFIASPNGQKNGIWGGGAGPAADAEGNLYFATGNGPFNQTVSPYTTDTNWGMTMIKLPATGPFTISYGNPLNWFTPNNWPTLNFGDADLGSSGLTLLPDQPGPHPHLLVGGGKGGQLYVIDRDSMGGLNTPNNSVQEITETNSMFVSPAYFNGRIYYAPGGGKLTQRAVSYNSADGSYLSRDNEAGTFKSTFTYNGGHGAHAFVSANGNSNGVVWALDLGTPIKLHAYNASNVSGNPIAVVQGTGYTGRKFCIPTVANGKVYFTADQNNSSRLFVVGLPPPPTGSPTAPSNVAATAVTSNKVHITWTDNSNNETGFKIKRATDPAGPWTTLVPNANANDIYYDDSTNLTAGTTYYYQVVATNVSGDSNFLSTVAVTTFPLFKPTGLVSYWSFDEGTGGTAFDATGSTRSASLNGEFAWEPGFQNGAVNYHGTGTAISNASVPNSAPLQFNVGDSFTLSGWMKQSAVSGNSQGVIVKSRDVGNYYGIYTTAGNQWAFRGNGGDVTGPTVVANTWTHVTAVQNGAANTRKLYINGVLAGTGAAQAANGTGPLWIAQGNPGTGIAFESFPGLIDEVRLYNRALTDAEIPSLLGPPILQAVSRQTQGLGGDLQIVLAPSDVKVIESRRGATQGAYKLVLSFSAPVSGISASLKKQSDGTAGTGTVGTITYDSTGTIVTVPLTGVANAQSLNLRLTGILPGNGIADVPFNVLWGDVNSDNVVDRHDLNLIQGKRGAALNATTARLDVNCDGQIGAADEILVASLFGGTVGAQTATNIALFRPATASSTNGGSGPNKSFDGDRLISRWESAFSDPQSITVNLGSISTIQSVVFYWEHSSGKTYTIETSTDGTNWTLFATEPNCPEGPVTKTYNAPGATTAKFVRMSGTTRTTPYGYSPFEMEVYGIPGNTGLEPVPVINSPASKAGAVSNSLTYQITATGTPTSYNATGLPPGLQINPTSGTITGTPTQQGTFNTTLTAVNENGAGTGTVTFNIEPQPTTPPTINSSLTSTGSLFTAYSYQVTALGAPSSYNATGLPSGLTINQISGLISGSPTAGGTFNVALTATNNIGTSTPVTLILTIDSGGYVNLARIAGSSVSATSELPPLVAAQAVDGSTVAPSRWESVHGADPQSFTVNFGQMCTVQFAMIYWEAAAGKTYTLEISNTGLPGSWTTVATEPNNTGAGTKSYQINATGQYLRMSGTTRTTGYGYSIYEFQIWGSIGAGPAAPVINSPLTATATAGTAFNYQITASGSPTSFNATNLPNGLTVNGSGLISGTPTAGGTANIGISATNGTGTDNKTLVLTVSAPITNPPVINSPLTASGATGTAFSYQITATNSPTSFQALNLPTGLSVNASGLISGTPSAAGTANITIKATNNIGTDTKTLVLSVASAPLNLSLGKTATASSNEAANTPANGNDASAANNGTRWTAANGTYPAWWRVDLGARKVISKVNVNWYQPANRVYKYKIEISDNDTSYTTIVDKSAATPGGNTTVGLTSDTINPTATARYVRVSVTGSNGGFASFYDCSVFGFDLPAGPSISSSLTATTATGTAFNYQIIASGNPTSFNATNLPAGLAISTVTGVISGTPTASGTANIGISATNVNGTDNKTLVLTINSNVALSKVASASTAQATNVATNANDGNTATRWSASSSTWPQVWSVDLGANKTLSGVNITWYSGATRAYKYKIETSTNGVDYTLAVDKTSNKTFGNSTDMFVATARYVRVTATGCSAGGAIASFYEVNIIGN